MKKLFILLTLIFNVLNTHVIAQEVDCVDDPDGMLIGTGYSCDGVNVIGYSLVEIFGCDADIEDGDFGFSFSFSVYELCPESCTDCGDDIQGCTDLEACNYNPDATEDDGSCEYADANADCSGNCFEGYTELTLMWSGAVDASMMTSFSVSGSANGELYSATLDTDSGSMTECWMTDLQADCFSIEIEGPDGLEWSIYSPLSDDPFLTGTNESMIMGSECTMGCMDPEGCNYDSSVQIDDASCTYPNSCVLSDGTWTQENPGTSNSNIFASGDNWELTECVFTQTNDNNDGTVTAIFTGGTFSSDCDEDFTDVQVNATFTQDPTTFLPTSDIDYIIQDNDTNVIYQNQASFGISIENGAPVATGYFDSTTIITDGCDYCSGETDGTGSVVDGDTDGDGVCNDNEIFGCTDPASCNYVLTATEDDGSCVVPTFENNIQCDECCMYSVGTWTHVNAFYLASSDTPTLSASAENWELSSAAFLYSQETINEDGSVSTISWFGADSDNSSILTGDCYNGQITLVLIFKTIDNTIVGDIIIKMFDDGDMYFETITSVDFVDLTTATMTGTIEAGNSGTLIMIDSDENGVGDCDETTFIQETDINDRTLVKTINILGQNVDASNKKSVLLYIYDDGTVEKKNQLR